MFSCEIFRNTFFYRTPLVVGSAYLKTSQHREADSEGGAGGAHPPFFFPITCLLFNHFEELQTMLFEVELIINNAPLT